MWERSKNHTEDKSTKAQIKPYAYDCITFEAKKYVKNTLNAAVSAVAMRETNTPVSLKI